MIFFWQSMMPCVEMQFYIKESTDQNLTAPYNPILIYWMIMEFTKAELLNLGSRNTYTIQDVS